MNARSFPRYYPLNKEVAMRTGIKKIIKNFREWSVDDTDPRRVVHDSKTLWIEPVIDTEDYYPPVLISESIAISEFIIGDPGSNAAFSILDSSGAIDKAYRAIIRHNTETFSNKLKIYLKLLG